MTQGSFTDSVLPRELRSYNSSYNYDSYYDDDCYGDDCEMTAVEWAITGIVLVALCIGSAVYYSIRRARRRRLNANNNTEQSSKPLQLAEVGA